MIRTSNKFNSGTRKNKKHKFVPTRIADNIVGPKGLETVDQFYAWVTHNSFGVSPNHQARVQDITDCWPLAKAGHAFMGA